MLLCVCVGRWNSLTWPLLHCCALDSLFTPLIPFFFLLLSGDGPFPGIIDLFGGIGGLVEFRASLLAAHGFAVLALAYFAYEDLPKPLLEVDLEYFEEAADLLLAHPKVFKNAFHLTLQHYCKRQKIITNVYSAYFSSLFRIGHSSIYSY